MTAYRASAAGVTPPPVTPPSTSTTGGVFTVTDYGALSNNNDNGRVTTTAFQQAHQAAVDNGGGIINIPPGTYLLTTQGAAITAKENLVGQIIWRGAGRGLTTIRLGTGVAGAAKLTTQLAGPEPKAFDQGMTYWPRSSVAAIEAGYDPAFDNETRENDWRDIQPNDTNTLSTNWVNDFTSFLNAARQNHRKMRLRIWTSCSRLSNTVPPYQGIGAPAWLIAQTGTFKHENPAVSSGGTKTIPRFWDPAFLTAYDNLIRLIAQTFDTHPAFLDCYIDVGGLVFQEPDIRDLFGSVYPFPQNRAELVGGGNGFDGSFIAPPGAGYSDALDKAAKKAAMDTHAHYLLHTMSTRAFNAYATITDYNTFSDSDNYNTTGAAMPNTKELIDYYVTTLGRRANCQNNSVKGTDFTWSGGSVGVGTPSINLGISQGYGVLLDYIVQKNTCRVFQTGTGGSNDPVTVNSSFEAVVTALHANGCEPALKTGTYPHDAASMTTWNNRLKANPLPPLPNNDLTYTAKTAGTAGNSITITYSVSGNSTPLTVSVASTAITVNVATNSSGAATSTASQVMAAITASTPAAALVTVTLPSNSNGSGIIKALSATNLAGGYGITACSTFQATPSTIPTGQPTYQNYAFEDFTLDGIGAGADNHGYLTHYTNGSIAGNTFDIGRHVYRRIDTTNWGHNFNFSRNAIRYVMNRGDIDLSPTCNVRDQYIEDVYMGRAGGGGTSGISMGCFVSGASTAKDPNGRYQPAVVFANQNENPGNYVIDQVYITNCSHDIGILPTSRGDSLGIQLGGDGITKHCRIKGGKYVGSGDVGIEIDNGIDIDIDGVVLGNTLGNAVLILPFGGIYHGQEANIRVRNCFCEWVGINPATGLTWSWTPLNNAFTINSRFGSFTSGSILFENCSVDIKGQYTQAVTVYQIGPARNITVRNCSSRDLAGPTAGSLKISHLRVLGQGFRSHVNIDGFHSTDAYTADGTTGNSTTVAMGSAQGLRLTAKNISASVDVNTINAGTFSNIIMDMTATGSSVTEPFTADSLDALDGTGGVCYFDAGASTDYAYDSGADNYNAGGANQSTEKRGIYITTNGNTGPDLIGRVIDGGQYMKFTPGASLTGYKAGAVFKRRFYDATTYGEGYVYDDGANSYLCLDKVVAGVRTTMLPSGTVTGGNGAAGSMTRVQFDASPPPESSGYGVLLETRLTSSTPHWQRVIIQNDTIYAEHFTVAPTTQFVRPTTGGGGDTGAYVTVTVTSTDQTNFGHYASGYWGFSHIPISTGALIDDLTHQRLHVISGEVSGLTPIYQHCRGGTGFQSNSAAGVLRVEGEFLVRDCNFVPGAVTTGTFSPVVNTDTSLVWRRRGISYPTVQAAVTITPTGSAFVWQNTTSCWGTLYVTGGTVSLIEMSKDGTTYQTTGLTTGQMRVVPGWYVRVTYTGAPTMTFEKED